MKPLVSLQFKPHGSGAIRIGTLCALIFTLFGVTGAASDPQIPVTVAGTERLIETDKDGRLVDSKLRSDTGWEILRTLTVAMDLREPNGEFRPVSTTRTFKTGDEFRLRVKATYPAYLYVLVHNSDGTHDLLLPTSKDKLEAVKPGHEVLIPPEEPLFQFQGATGKEKLRIIASPVRLPDIAPPQLFEDPTNAVRTVREREVFAQLRTVQSQSVAREIKRQEARKRVRSMADAAQQIREGKLERAVEVVAIEEIEGRQTTTTVSSNGHQGSAQVAELVLTHESR